MYLLRQQFIKLFIIIFSIVILAGFGSYLLWSIDEREKEFHSSHAAIAEQATNTVAQEIERTLAQKNKLVSSFVIDNQNLMDALVDNPENEKLFSELNNKLSRYFLDYYSTSIASSEGDLLIDDFDGYIGELCVKDMKEYVETNQHLNRIHPHPKVYHYDIVVKFTSKQQEYLFLVSFMLDSLSSILKLSSPPNHNLMLVNSENNNLIEVTEKGSRLSMPQRLDFRMSAQELGRLLSETIVKGTYWHVYDLHNVNLFDNYSKNLRNRNILIYSYVVLLVVFFTIFLLIQVGKNKKVADDLLKKNTEIEVLNAILKDKNEELSEQAMTDSLTRVYNRRYFDKQVVSEWNRASRLWLPINIGLIDIDYFKQYNDMYGHQLGDVCLKVVAELLADYFKRSNEFVARYGGEEFVVVNIGSKPEFFKMCMQELLTILSEKNIEHEGSMIGNKLTMSIGIASTGDAKITSSDVLINLADKALYDAKEQGRNQVVQRKVE